MVWVMVVVMVMVMAEPQTDLLEVEGQLTFAEHDLEEKDIVHGQGQE